MARHEHQFSALPIGTHCDDFVLDLVAVGAIVALTHGYEPIAVGARSPVGIAIARGGQLCLSARVGVEAEHLATPRIIAVVEDATGHPPGTTAVLVNPRANVRVGPGDLGDLAVAPADNCNSTALIGTTLRPVHIVAIGVHFGDSHCSGDE